MSQKVECKGKIEGVTFEINSHDEMRGGVGPWGHQSWVCHFDDLVIDIRGGKIEGEIGKGFYNMNPSPGLELSLEINGVRISPIYSNKSHFMVALSMTDIKTGHVMLLSIPGEVIECWHDYIVVDRYSKNETWVSGGGYLSGYGVHTISYYKVKCSRCGKERERRVH